ncbi:MAG: hypothetical protein JWL90_4347 [Chthoniobacteraceae bacterium]|nr:hypothetical protein [Chthoniobacteraceae bacterium]
MRRSLDYAPSACRRQRSEVACPVTLPHHVHFPLHSLTFEPRAVRCRVPQEDRSQAFRISYLHFFRASRPPVPASTHGCKNRTARKLPPLHLPARQLERSTFRAFKSAAPLKHAKGRTAPGSIVTTFRAFKSAAPLKPGNGLREARRLRAFRAFKSAAPLKPNLPGVAGGCAAGFRAF